LKSPTSKPPVLVNPHAESVAIIGGGPAGLMAAEVIAQAGFNVSVYDAMPSVGRKFLLAGVGGMNITHAEPSPQFLSRYGDARAHLAPIINTFDANALRGWVEDLGIETFVGTSGRVFPKEMKAAPLLRAWLHRLRESNVSFYPRHRWLGWNSEGALRFCVDSAKDEHQEHLVSAKACVLALGGASWPRLGSDGAGIEALANMILPSPRCNRVIAASNATGATFFAVAVRVSH